MTTVNHLFPGDVVRTPVGSATFIAATDHPLFTGLQLVTWRMADGTWSLDALSGEQEVGQAEATDAAARREALRAALLGSGDQ